MKESRLGHFDIPVKQKYAGWFYSLWKTYTCFLVFFIMDDSMLNNNLKDLNTLSFFTWKFNLQDYSTYLLWVSCSSSNLKDLKQKNFHVFTWKIYFNLKIWRQGLGFSLPVVEHDLQFQLALAMLNVRVCRKISFKSFKLFHWNFINLEWPAILAGISFH